MMAQTYLFLNGLTGSAPVTVGMEIAKLASASAMDRTEMRLGENTEPEKGRFRSKKVQSSQIRRSSSALLVVDAACMRNR